MSRIVRLSIAALAVALLVPVVSAKEEKVSPDKLPQSVLQAVKARFKELPIKGAGREIEEGKPVYEVSLVEKGKTIDVTVSPEGNLLKIEREIARKGLPKAAVEALEQKYPKATWKIVEEITTVENKKETLAGYEVLLATEQGQIVEVELAGDGTISNVEEKKGPATQEAEGEDEDEDDE